MVDQARAIRIESVDPDLVSQLAGIVGANNVTLESTGLVLPHTASVTKLLRMKGFDTPAPILTQYNFPTFDPNKPAFHIQKQTCAMLTMDRRGYVLNELGTGKTRCILWAYDYLRSIKLANKMLVICPVSAMQRTWGDELRREFHWLKFEILHHSSGKSKRIERLANTNADVYIINHDGLKVMFDELQLRKDIDTVCVDELGVFRDGGSGRTKTLKAYIYGKRWAWGLTGAPIPRSVTDVWGPCSAITPLTVPNYFTHFRAMLMYKIPNNQKWGWEPKPGAEAKAVACMTPSVRFRLDEITELPPRVFNYYEAPLTPKQGTIYEAMRQEAIALVKDDKIDALNAGAVLSKLFQISLGYVYTREGKIITLDNTPRLQLILDLVDGSEKKVILFAPFKSAISGLSAMLEANKVDHAIVHGDVSIAKRNTIFYDFQNTKTYHVLLAHPVCMAHSLTLTNASTIIWAGPVTSLDTFIQANARIYRTGQTSKTLIAMIGGTGCEKKMYQLLSRNEKTQNKFLEIVESKSSDITF